jgi:hypothetical protein
VPLVDIFSRSFPLLHPLNLSRFFSSRRKLKNSFIDHGHKCFFNDSSLVSSASDADQFPWIGPSKNLFLRNKPPMISTFCCGVWLPVASLIDVEFGENISGGGEVICVLKTVSLLVVVVESRECKSAGIVAITKFPLEDLPLLNASPLERFSDEPPRVILLLWTAAPTALIGWIMPIIGWFGGVPSTAVDAACCRSCSACCW